MSLLYYWRRDNYLRDLDMGAGYHLNQANPTLHQIEIGDTLFAITRNKLGKYVFAAKLVIRAKTINPPNFRYGRYRVWGDLSNSRYFRIDNQPNAELIIRSLSCRTEASILGQAFQGRAAVRLLTQQDYEILSAAVKGLEIETRARILPEDKLEASLLLGDKKGVASLLKNENPGIAEQRVEYLYKQAADRNKLLVSELQELYKGRCQICLWNPQNIYRKYLCQGHHVNWLSRGGEDTLKNMVLVCSNHHTAIHRCDAQFDYRGSSFDFGNRREMLKLDYHFLKSRK
jgi:5-methylcytosine-specific restriction protein A